MTACPMSDLTRSSSGSVLSSTPSLTIRHSRIPSLIPASPAPFSANPRAGESSSSLHAADRVSNDGSTYTARSDDRTSTSSIPSLVGATGGLQAFGSPAKTPPMRVGGTTVAGGGGSGRTPLSSRPPMASLDPHVSTSRISLAAAAAAAASSSSSAAPKMQSFREAHGLPLGSGASARSLGAVRGSHQGGDGSQATSGRSTPGSLTPTGLAAAALKPGVGGGGAATSLGNLRRNFSGYGGGDSSRGGSLYNGDEGPGGSGGGPRGSGGGPEDYTEESYGGDFGPVTLLGLPSAVLDPWAANGAVGKVKSGIVVAVRMRPLR